MTTPALQSAELAISVNIDLCGNCIFCLSVCPFEAITQNPDTKKVKIDPVKCRLCGICYATCPSRLISIQYYDTESLASYIRERMAKEGADELVVACRGTALTPATWRQKLGIDRPTAMYFSLPCLGRLHLNFYVEAASAGLKKIILVSCEQEFCRYKKGSETVSNRFAAAQPVLDDLGFGSDMLELRTLAPRAEIDDKKCITCGTCAFVCPYEAIQIKDSAARLEKEKCKGCGLCVPGCPAIAIKLEGSDCDAVTKEIAEFAGGPAKPKVLVLGCQWSEYRSCDEGAAARPGVKFLKMPCSGRTDVLHILKALSAGIDGVMVTMCLDDICNLETGNKRAFSRVAKVMESLAKLGVQDRVKIAPVHPKYLGMFENELNAFVSKLAQGKR
ncbi:MAG: hydrogenase iron-sulfur subunit [Planctomycetota bacterium]|nr:hydrogenase iron-sulfur subunit [Planctomycetota bacterium]